MTARVGSLGGAPLAMAQTRDIARHGLFVELMLTDPSWAVAVDDLLQIRFSLPSSDLIEAVVRVARIERDASSLRGVGLEFKQLGDRERALIDEYVGRTWDDA